MDTTKYSCVFDGQSYLVYNTIYNTYLRPKSVTVIRGEHTIQTFTYSRTIVSYTTPDVPSDLVYVLYSFLTQIGYPLPHLIINNIPVIQYHKVYEEHKDIITFSTATYSFDAQIKEEPFHYAVKIGGKEFMGCIELFVNKPEHPYYKSPKLAQVYSEPECWYQLGKKGEIVDLLRGTFELCQILFGVNVFCLNDNSNIECGITTRTSAPPRKLEKPFSLAHLSIAKKGKTWYEEHFNAFIQDADRRREYEQAVQQLDNPKQTDDFDSFAAINYLSREQYDGLKSLYESAATWRAFFANIPKDKTCSLLFNWLPDYMDKHILHFAPTKYEWCIYVEPLGIYEKEEVYEMPHMERTAMLIHPNSRQTGGSNRKNRTLRQRRERRYQTRKQRTLLLSFSNQY